MKTFALIVVCISLLGCGGNSDSIDLTNMHLNENLILVGSDKYHAPGRPVLLVDVTTGDVVKEMPFSAEDVSVSTDRKKVLFSTAPSSSKIAKVFDLVAGQEVASKTVASLPTRFGPTPDRLTYSTDEYFNSVRWDGSDPISYLSITSDSSHRGVFSPNGERLISLPARFQTIKRILELRDKRGQVLYPLIDDGGTEHIPSWAPDNQRIALYSRLSGTAKIIILDTVTRESRDLLDFETSGYPITTGGPTANLKISWSPDGKALVFTAHVGSTPYVFYMKSDGTGLRLLGNLKYTGGSVAWTN